MTTVANAGGGEPVAPIVHDGCIYAVVTDAAGADPHLQRRDRPDDAARRGHRHVAAAAAGQRVDLGQRPRHRCGVGDRQRRPSSSASTSGATRSRSPTARATRTSSSGGAGEDEENPDADDAVFKRADQIDEDGINQPPVARDDEAATRTDQPVIVHVLANDEDPDGDVLLVTELQRPPGRCTGDADVGPHRRAGDPGARLHRQPVVLLHDHRRPRRRGDSQRRCRRSSRTTGRQPPAGHRHRRRRGPRRLAGVGRRAGQRQRPRRRHARPAVGARRLRHRRRSTRAARSRSRRTPASRRARWSSRTRRPTRSAPQPTAR